MFAACGESEGPVCREPAQLVAKGVVGPSPPQQLVELPRMAVGATTSVPLYCDTTVGFCGHYCNLAPFDLPLEIDVRDGLVSYTGRDAEGALGFRAERNGNGVIAFVDPRDDSIYGEVAVHVSDLDQLILTRNITEREPTDLAIVLATGQAGPHFGVRLYNTTGDILVDDSLEMQLPPGAQRVGNEIDLFGVASGIHTLGFQASGKSFTESLEIVNEAESIEVWEAPATIPRNPITPGALEYVCFMAKAGGRYITGLRWQHVVDGLPADPAYNHGCVLATTDVASGSPVTFMASAGGKSLTVQIPAR
jgi:hypothetical protein